jgi:chaperonin GroEL (HSP60 family)
VDDPEVTLDLMEKISQLSHNFSAMSEAVSNHNTLKLFSGTASDHDYLANFFVTLREEKLKRAEENGEVTFYDFTVGMDELVNRLM